MATANRGSKCHTPASHCLHCCIEILTQIVCCGDRAYWSRVTGKDYDGRYADYEQEYADYVEDCRKHGEEPKERKVRKKGGFHAISATVSIPRQIARLNQLRQEGLVRTSPNVNRTGKGLMVAWATNAVALVEAKSMVCYQACLVNAVGVSLAHLGIAAAPLPRDQYDPAARASFKDMQTMLGGGGSDFELRKEGIDFDWVMEVFTQTVGVYLLYASVTHWEDADFEHAEVVPHYIVYNAGTRVLFLNPEVVVVDDSDMHDLAGFVHKISQAPYLVRLHQGAARRTIRRLWVARARAHLYPYHAPELL